MRKLTYVRFANAVLVGPSVDAQMSLSEGQLVGGERVTFEIDDHRPDLFVKIITHLRRGGEFKQLVPWAQVTGLNYTEEAAPVVVNAPARKPRKAKSI